jgi:hypothetical protein
MDDELVVWPRFRFLSALGSSSSLSSRYQGARIFIYACATGCQLCSRSGIFNCLVAMSLGSWDSGRETCVQEMLVYVYC